MKLKKTSIMCAVTIALATHFSVLSAKQPIDQSLIDGARPMVHMALESLVVEAPFASSLMVMNVRVFNQENELVLAERSESGFVELVTSDLPDGKYRYEAVSIFQLDAPVGEGPSYTKDGISRNYGGFSVNAGMVTGDAQQSNHDSQRQREDASLMDRMIEQAVNLAGITLNTLIPSAHAANLTAESTNPSVLFDDTQDEVCSPSWDWRIYADGGSAGDDVTNTYKLTGTGEGSGSCGFDVRIFEFGHNGGDGAASSENSLIVDPNGDIHWAGSAMNFDRSAQKLSVGAQTSNQGDITIYSDRPHIWLHDETDTAEGDWQLNDGRVKFWSRPSTADSWRIPVSYDADAPGSSIWMDGSGNVGFGTTAPEENLHASGNIRTDGYFRGQSINPGFWIDETGTGNKGANVVLDGGVLQIQRRSQGFGGFEASIFRLNVQAPAQSFTLNSVGYLGLGIQNAIYPIQSSTGARLSAGGVWQNASSRDLKENILDIDAAQAMAAFKELKPVTYNYKVDSEDTYIGFIAEDVPEIVASKDRKTLSSMDMVALVTRVVQDQQNTIEEKSLRIEALEQQLENQAQQYAQQQEQIEKLETMIRLVAGLEGVEKEVAVNLR